MIQGYNDTRIKEYKDKRMRGYLLDNRMQGCKDTRILEYKFIRIQGCKDTGIQ